MLKRFLAAFLLVVGLSIAAPTVQAINLSTGLTDAGGPNGAGYDIEQDIVVTIGLIIQILIAFLGVIFLVLVIYAGFVWMTAAGDAKRVEKAKGTLTTAVIGLVIILAAYSITTFVIGRLQFATDGATSDY